ncbi:MAG: GAK system CofD-like protein [Deltaproteobacteria bacterium]|nr:GAK system CofD-like protein [Deltaproteobacteria bacterium]MBW2413646.1 GAK system CofD-like protein [Deltaproteobacteria bacterium]
MQQPESGPRILFLSGGTALRETVRWLKYETWNSIHLITPFDSGGSSARLRDAFGMPSVGDLRNRMIALGDEWQAGNREVFTLVNHRFPADGERERDLRELSGLVSGEDPRVAALLPEARDTFLECIRAFDAARPRDFDLREAKVGNLALAGGYLLAGRKLEPAIERFSELTAVRGVVRPVVEANLHLAAELEDGTTLIGQHLITGRDGPPITSPIRDLWLVDSLQGGARCAPALSKSVLELIASADLIVYPIGSFYTSVCCNLLPAGMGEALWKSPVRHVYVPNPLPDPEQRGMTIAGAVETIERLAGHDTVDTVLYDPTWIGYPSLPDPDALRDLDLDCAERDLVAEDGRADPERLALALLELCD